MVRSSPIARAAAGLVWTAAAWLVVGAGDAQAQREMTPDAPMLRAQPKEDGQGGYRVSPEVPAGRADVTYQVEGSYRKADGEEWIYPGMLAANVAAGTSGIEIPAAMVRSIAPPDAQWRFRARVSDPPGPWSEWVEAGAPAAPAEAQNRRVLRTPDAATTPSTEPVSGGPEAQRGAVVMGPVEAELPEGTAGRVAVPGETLRQARPDYAISLDWQFEYDNTAMAWRFRVDNKGKATPDSKPADWTKIKHTSATLVISAGVTCPETKQWKKVASFNVPPLKPGEFALVPENHYRMSDDTVGRGCRFRAELVGMSDDSNPANNTMQMITKVALLPDLVVLRKEGLAEVWVRNQGKAAAGSSLFHYEACLSEDEFYCTHPNPKNSPKHVFREVVVPPLDPGKSFKAMKSPWEPFGTIPDHVIWRATADFEKAVPESQEGNNVLKGVR
ncbi:MAG: hypothetical protein L6Q83_13080 [Gammaproteobacteria bacterium]|nr:hypothetical protein [Gammaproteobacteria bacterium]